MLSVYLCSVRCYWIKNYRQCAPSWALNSKHVGTSNTLFSQHHQRLKYATRRAVVNALWRWRWLVCGNGSPKLRMKWSNGGDEDYDHNEYDNRGVLLKCLDVGVGVASRSQKRAPCVWVWVQDAAERDFSLPRPREGAWTWFALFKFSVRDWAQTLTL